MSEATPLLPSPPDTKIDPYGHFSRLRKRLIVTIVSCCGLLSLFVSGCFIPSIPRIAEELDSTPSIINLAVSLSILTVSIGSLFWATYSGFYGRRPIYLGSLPILCLGSIGVALSQSVAQLLVFRMLQGFGASSGLSVGTGVIADIYKLEERGTAMGIFFGAILLGPALAPLAGGVAAYYFTWRHMHWSLMFCALMCFLSVVFFLPETSHPGSRGIEKLETDRRKPFHVVWLNPLKSVWLLRSPNLMAVTLTGTFTLLTDYVMLLPLAYTIGTRYNITNEALIGAFFLPVGVGNMVGAPLSGRFSDHIVIKWRKRRNGEWVPEDRLRAALFGAGVLVPLSVLLSGIFTHFIDGTPGIVLNLICMFVNGIGVDYVLTPSAAYNTDVLHSRSAEVMAANNGFRGVILAMAAAAILPSINAIGVLWTNFIAAILGWIGFGFLYLTIKYGDRMRAYVDVGFTTSPDA
ncbi:MFS general substrate transporter [Rickenella mellea]|uniref:MFS general substrate transporter n=1 Tax=Rickenella mellea TaxID=50990 RepID=A0A4Y7PTZ6_9AGAM|nr:MFS general substrate transporter [Rickenella mellea]